MKYYISYAYQWMGSTSISSAVIEYDGKLNENIAFKLLDEKGELNNKGLIKIISWSETF